MQAFTLLTPWLVFLLILYPALWLERWIHQHLYGVGWLLTRDKQQATVFYYVILLPGIFLHEFTQWLFAGAFRLKTSKVKVWPRPQKNGSLRFDFVKLAGRKHNRFIKAGFEFSPVLTGLAAILFISNRIFNVDLLVAAAASGDLPLLLTALQRFIATPDFWLWLYLLFAVGNAMLPTPGDQLPFSWIARIAGGITLGLIIIGALAGTGIATLQGPLTAILNRLAAAFAVILFVDLGAAALISLTERTLERMTGEQMRYTVRRQSRAPTPEPGGEVPLPPELAPAPIDQRKLPIPPPPKKERKSIDRPQPLPEAKPANLPQRPSWIDQHSAPQATQAGNSATTEDVIEPEEEPLSGNKGATTAADVLEQHEQPLPEMEGEDTEAVEEETADDSTDDELEYVDLDDIA